MTSNLFHQPFYNPSTAFSYGTGNANNGNSQQHQPETTPLRRRENDMVWQSPPHGLNYEADEQHSSRQPRNSFAELPSFRHRNRYYRGSSNNSNYFPHRQRKDRWVQYVMKGVLLSPVVVLVIWSVAAAYTVNNHNNNNNSMAMKQQGSPARSAVRIPVRPKTKQRTSSSGSSSTETAKDILLEGVEVVETALGKAQKVLIPQGGRRTSTHKEGKMLPVYAPLGSTNNNNNMIVQPSNIVGQQQQNSNNNQYQEQPAVQTSSMMMMEEPVPMQSQVAMGSTGGGGSQQQQQSLPVVSESWEEQQQPFVQANGMEGTSLLMSTGGSSRAHPLPRPHPRATGGRVHPAPRPPPRAAAPQYLRGSNNNLRPATVMYYYDPRHARRTTTGQILLPDMVYDVTGRPILTNNVIESAQEVYLEPPASMIHHNISSNATYVNYTHSHPNVHSGRVMENKKGMSYFSSASTPSTSSSSKPNNWFQSSEGNATDQSIIVATVAVMAILVGAVSARRLRARAWISNCIENESLSNEAAYDSAYTIGHGGPGSGGDYSTFNAAASWKGDLEKFDV